MTSEGVDGLTIPILQKRKQNKGEGGLKAPHPTKQATLPSPPLHCILTGKGVGRVGGGCLR